MRLDQLQVELRPRSPWEAMELGTALVRREGRTLWRAWGLASVPALLVLNAAGWALDKVWLAGLAMWWLKPAFDRIALLVLSRAVFGQHAGVREAALAPLRFGRDRLLADLTWARIGLSRALFLPAALLEGARGATLAARKRVLAAQDGQSVWALTLLCLHFDLLLSLSVVLLLPAFVPVEYLGESARAIWETLFQRPPRWAQVLLNLLAWGATTLVEPFYVGAGFGLYLNRRTQLEGWDIEIAFRRMGARLRAAAAATAPVLALCALLAWAPRADARQGEDAATPAHAAQCPAPAGWDSAGKPRPRTATAASVFGPAAVDARRFEQAVRRAYRDPLLRPTRTERTWVPKQREPRKRQQASKLPWLGALAGWFTEGVLWTLLALAALWLLWRLPRWWPELWRPLPRAPAAAPVQEAAAPHHDALPADIAAAARTLWAGGRPRAALALLYRASVEAMATRTGAELPPGATEAQCLRAARALRDGEDRSAFADVVRTWQLAAYAQRLPDTAGFEALLLRGGRRFGWAA